MAGFKSNTGSKKAGDRISTLSTFGLNLQNMLIKNSFTLQKSNNNFSSNQTTSGSFGGAYNNDWDLFNFATSQGGVHSQASEKRNYEALRKELRDFSRQDSIEEIIETLADEAIVYDDKGSFCEPGEMTIDIKPEIIESYHSNFKNIYYLLGLNDGKRGWDLFKKWLVDGYISFEIIYNDSESEIIGFKELDPKDLYFIGMNKKSKVFEWQYKNPLSGSIQILPDSKVIYISYAGVDNNGRISYIQRLLRAYNVLDVMEQSRVIYAVTQSVFNKLFTIPVGGKSKTQAKQSLATLISSYKEKVHWDSKSGELEINGSKDLPFYKEYWFPEKDGQKPQIDSVSADGPDLSNMEPLEYFEKKLYRASKIPSSRFEERGGGNFNLGSPADIERDEIRFSNFINRLISSFKELLLKPLWIQMVLDYSNLENDTRFENEMSIVFNKNNLFKMLKKQEILDSQAQLIDTLKRIEGDGGDRESYFTADILIKEFLDVDEDMLERNAQHKKDIKESKKDDDSGGRF